MATEKTFNSTTAENVEIDLTSGEIIVEATNEVTKVEVVVRTADDEGESAVLVNNTRFREYLNNVVGIRVPEPVSKNMTIGGSINITGGRTFVNGKEVTTDSRGAMVLSKGVSPIQVIVKMPRGHNLTIEGTNTNILAEGNYNEVRIKAVNDPIIVEDVALLNVDTVNGSVLVHKATGMAAIRSVNGKVTVEDASKTKAVMVSTVNGNIRLRGTGHLDKGDLRVSTVNGSRNVN